MIQNEFNRNLFKPIRMKFFGIKMYIHKHNILKKIIYKKEPISQEELRNNKEALIKSLFAEFKDLTRQEIARKVNISLPTATNDLKKLLQDNYILKIEPTASSRSHYFILNPNK